MLRELTFVAGLIVYSMSAKIIMWHPIARDSILLLHDLIESRLGDLLCVRLFLEVLVVLVCRCNVGLVLFETHFKVCHSVCLGTLGVRFLLLLEFTRTIGVIR